MLVFNLAVVVATLLVVGLDGVEGTIGVVSLDEVIIEWVLVKPEVVVIVGFKLGVVNVVCTL